MKDMKNIFALAALTLVSGAAAQNPVVQTWFTTDPAPLVHNESCSTNMVYNRSGTTCA